ncbi:MAG: hypothetical protein ABI467_00175 [Kofleriaceae bacterium]
MIRRSTITKSGSPAIEGAHSLRIGYNRAARQGVGSAPDYTNKREL